MDVPVYCAIVDERLLKELQVQTYMGYRRTDVIKKMRNNILEGKLEESCHWAIELHISGCIGYIWQECIDIMATNINIKNPRLAHYLWSRYRKYQQLLDSYNDNFHLECRNNQEMRNLLADIITVVVLSQKISKLTLPKITHADYGKELVLKHVKAKSMDLVAEYILPDDDDEIKIAINEIAYAIRMRQQQDAIYWLYWLENADKIRQQNNVSALKTAARPIENIDEKYSEDWIWFIWKICLIQKIDKHTFHAIDALFHFTLLNYNWQTRKSKIKLLHFALTILTDDRISWNVPVIIKNEIRVRACANINKLYVGIESPVKNNVANNVANNNANNNAANNNAANNNAANNNAVIRNNEMKKIQYKMRREFVKPRLQIKTNNKTEPFKIKDERNRELENLGHRLELLNSIIVYRKGDKEQQVQITEQQDQQKEQPQEQQDHEQQEEQQQEQQQESEQQQQEEQQQDEPQEEEDDANSLKTILIPLLRDKYMQN